MTTLTVIVQWCHVVAAILWAGGAATFDVIATPILDRVPELQARAVGSRLVGRATLFFSVTAGACSSGAACSSWGSGVRTEGSAAPPGGDNPLWWRPA
jgi:hypothetical protein